MMNFIQSRSLVSALGDGPATVTPQASSAPPVPERPPARVMSHVAASAPVTARLAPRLDGDCRRWRFLGDVCVDAALVIELATPHAGDFACTLVLPMKPG